MSSSQSEASVSHDVLLVLQVRGAELPPHPGRRGEAPTSRRGPHPQEHVWDQGEGPGARQAVVAGVRLEWCIVGVVVGVGVELMVLALIIVEASFSVSAPSTPPSPVAAPTGGHPPPLSGSPLVTAVAPPALLRVAVVGGAVQGVAALTPVVVLVVALLVVGEATLVALVTLLPSAMRAGCPHAWRRGREWEGQEGGRRSLRRGKASPVFLLHAFFVSSPLPRQSEGLQGLAGGSP